MLSGDLKVFATAQELLSKHSELLPPLLNVFSTTGTYIMTNDGRIFAIRSGKISRPAVGDSTVSRGTLSYLLFLVSVIKFSYNSYNFESSVYLSGVLYWRELS